MNNDLISRGSLKKEMLFCLNQEITKYKTMRRALGNVGRVAIECVEEVPAVDAEVVRHGRWEVVENTGHEEWCAPPIRCSNCGKTMPDVGAGFCPFCGQMNVEVQDVPQD